MTTITFTYAASLLPIGKYVIHLYVRQEEPTWDLSPRSERQAIKDAAQTLCDLMRENDTSSEERLLKDGEPPPDAIIICRFRLNVSWNRTLRMPHYSRGDYERLEWDGRWNPIAELMMEQRDYTYAVLRKREKSEIKRKTRQ